MAQECSWRASPRRAAVSRLHALVEGQTEEAFFNRTIVGHLAAKGVYADVRVINPKKNSNFRLHKGGWKSYNSANGDLLRWMKEDPNAWFTTMVDMYALPTDFPEYSGIKERIQDPYQRVQAFEGAWKTDLGSAGSRFIPYIQLHEFEALLLVEPQRLDWEFLEHDQAIQNLNRMAKDKNPELIDDGPETAPSKRIIQAIPEYEDRKQSVGPLVADKIGLENLRGKCRHFDDWLTSLEGLLDKDDH